MTRTSALQTSKVKCGMSKCEYMPTMCLFFTSGTHETYCITHAQSFDPELVVERLVLIGPAVLQLNEEGDWSLPSWSRNPDDEQWEHEGWSARTYEGRRLYQHSDRLKVISWLTHSGYVAAPDGEHYTRAISR
jgi:hypothetical protein